MTDRSSSSLARRFSRGAEAYAEEALLQQGIAKKLLTLIPSASAYPHILEIGCGTGFLTSLLAERFSSSHIVALDLSAGMLQRASSHYCHLSNVRWLQANAIHYLSPQKMDLVISSSSLHWLSPLRPIFQKVREDFLDQGPFIFSIMLKGTLGELHSLRHELFPQKVPQAELPSIAEVQTALEEAGFRTQQIVQQTVTEYAPDALSLLWRLHRLGLTGGAFSQGSKPLTRSELSLLVKEYQSRFGSCSKQQNVPYSFCYALIEAQG